MHTQTCPSHSLSSDRAFSLSLFSPFLYPLKLCVHFSPPVAGFQMSPYHHYGLPPKNSGHTASMDSIITVTTLAGEDDAVDSNGASVGRVAGWCASFDKLLADPLGVECLLVSDTWPCSHLCMFMHAGVYVNAQI